MFNSLKNLISFTLLYCEKVQIKLCYIISTFSNFPNYNFGFAVVFIFIVFLAKN